FILRLRCERCVEVSRRHPSISAFFPLGGGVPCSTADIAGSVARYRGEKVYWSVQRSLKGSDPATAATTTARPKHEPAATLVYPQSLCGMSQRCARRSEQEHRKQDALSHLIVAEDSSMTRGRPQGG